MARLPPRRLPPRAAVLRRAAAKVRVLNQLDPRHLPPDDRTLAWVARQLGARTASVVERLAGGLDAATHLVVTDDGRDAVLRRATGEWAEWRDGIFRRESAILSQLPSGLPVARLLASDLDAVATDVPTMLVSRLPGRLVYPSLPEPEWLEGYGLTLAGIHQQPLPEAGWPWTDHGARLQELLERPRWAVLRERGVPVAPTVFLHGDFWTGNLLFDRGRLTGIVDWGEAGTGPGPLELMHARAELIVGVGSELLVDEVVRAYESVHGPTADAAWWQVAGFLLFPDDPADWLVSWTENGVPMDAETVRRRHEAGLSAALQRLRA